MVADLVEHKGLAPSAEQPIVCCAEWNLLGLPGMWLCFVTVSKRTSQLLSSRFCLHANSCCPGDLKHATRQPAHVFNCSLRPVMVLDRVKACCRFQRADDGHDGHQEGQAHFTQRLVLDMDAVILG